MGASWGTSFGAPLPRVSNPAGNLPGNLAGRESCIETWVSQQRDDQTIDGTKLGEIGGSREDQPVPIANLDFLGAGDQQPGQCVDVGLILADLLTPLPLLGSPVSNRPLRPLPVLPQLGRRCWGCRWVESDRFNGAATDPIARGV
jgi:hypothetical protein